MISGSTTTDLLTPIYGAFSKLCFVLVNFILISETWASSVGAGAGGDQWVYDPLITSCPKTPITLNVSPISKKESKLLKI